MITPIQHQIYQFISEYIQEHGYSPILTEIAKGVGINPKSKSFISDCVHALAKDGLLNLGPKHKSRNIQLTQSKTTLPLMGRIAAGAPIEAIQQAEPLDLASLFAGDKHYSLEVKGNSMIEEGILDGDKVICRQQSTATEGDIIVALIDNLEATLKRIRYTSPNQITLLPANKELNPQVYAAERIQIQGLFVGLLRLHKKG
jgi:repressor LexA